MNKIRFAYSIPAMLLLVCGCQRMEELEVPDPAVTGKPLVTATLESGADTRTYLSAPDDQGIYYPFWSEKDYLAVYVNGLDRADKYSLVSGAGSSSGQFAGTLYGTRRVALYPFDDRSESGLQGDILHLNLPAVQTYAEGSFADGSYPMVAVSSTDELNFKNLCSVLKVSLTGTADVQSVKFIAHDSWMPVSGPATVRTDFQDLPELVMADDGSNEVTLRCGFVTLDPERPTDFFLVIPPGTYRGGFSLEIKTFRGTITRSTDADIVFERSQMRAIPTFECVADGEIDPDDIPHNQIWYTSSNYQVFNPSGGVFDRQIVSNTYSDGKGVIVFDGPVTQVGKKAFYGGRVTSVILPNSIETIGDYAFAYSEMPSFHTPENLTTVSEGAFYSCYNLSRIYGRHASGDEKALILDGTMVAYALGALDADLVIPDGVKVIPSGLFRYCENLETVEFPASVTEVGRFAFASCPNLREFRGNNEHVPDGHAFINTGGAMVAWAGSGLVDYVIPPTMSFFDYTVFANNKTIRSLTFPALKIGTYWFTDYFYGCDNLEYFYGEGTTDDHHCLIVWGNCLFSLTKVLPADYKVPGGYGITQVFYEIARSNATVERLSFPDDITYIGSYSFANMPKIKSVRLPSALSSMGNDLFDNTTCLDTLYMRSFTPPSYEENYGGFAHDGLVICVPEGFEEQYKHAPTWSNYAEYIRGYHYADLPQPDYYISKDFSRDGTVTRLQKATRGNGIDVVLMGDAFSDRQIADGTYRSVMDKMAAAFFSEEPYTTCRDLFNVYAVDVVSATEGYEHAGQALSGWFGNGTQVGGNDTKCMDYARKVVGDDRMNDVLIIVAMNSPRYAGTCYMYYPSGGDYGCGTSVAYFPIGDDDEGLAQLVHHEAGGHGFAKLDDEYSYDGEISQAEIEGKKNVGPLGWWKNVDFTSDPDEVKWTRFLRDERYKFDGLGVFEGACTYSKGAWRPTENSIMRHNTGGYNAPSREAIWYRIHKLAYGESWQYDYEEFVAYDAVNRKTSAGAAPSVGRRFDLNRAPTHPPVVIPRRWNEAPESVPSEIPFLR